MRLAANATVARTCGAAALAAAVSACGGDIAVRSGGAPGGALPTEARLSAGGASGGARGAAAWRILGDGVGSGSSRANLVTAADLAGLHQGVLADAARAAPRYVHDSWRGYIGGVTKSDTLTPQNRLSTPTLSASLGHNAAGEVTYRLNYIEWGRGVVESWTFDSEAQGTTVQRWSDGGRKGALFRRSDSSGAHWAAVTTDISGRYDSDWLATGVWARRPADGAYANYRFGVFADGGDRFPASRVAALTGTATYTGDATGVYSRRTGADGASRRTEFFEADAVLTADFSAKPGATGEGYISGRVHNISVGGTAIAGSPEIALNRARISANGSVHAALTRMTFDGSSWTGSWGGEFYGARGVRQPPGAIAGVFGATAGSKYNGTAKTFIGAFGASRTSWTNAPEGRRASAFGGRWGFGGG